MGLFDFLTGKSKGKQPVKVNDKNTQTETIKYETKLTARDITNDAEILKKIVEKMVEEDPFKNFYSDKSEVDFSVSSTRTYKYDSITTVNVNVVDEDKNELSIYIEGLLLGTIPQQLSHEIKQYQEKYMLTAYVYITGGPFKEYSKNTETVEDGAAPFGLDIFIQFT